MEGHKDCTSLWPGDPRRVRRKGRLELCLGFPWGQQDKGEYYLGWANLSNPYGLGFKGQSSQPDSGRKYTGGMLAWCESDMFLTGSSFEYLVSELWQILKNQEVGPGWWKYIIRIHSSQVLSTQFCPMLLASWVALHTSYLLLEVSAAMD